MRLIAMLTLSFLPLAHAAAQDLASAGGLRPAACADFKTTVSVPSVEHVPYPPIRQTWPVDVSTATIVKDPLAAGRVVNFQPVSVEQVRKQFKRYFVLPRTEWEHGYSHVGGHDEAGWLIAGGRCFRWTMRPGGLGWIVYPDGTAVYLAAELHRIYGAVPLR